MAEVVEAAVISLTHGTEIHDGTSVRMLFLIGLIKFLDFASDVYAGFATGSVSLMAAAAVELLVEILKLLDRGRLARTPIPGWEHKAKTDKRYMLAPFGTKQPKPTFGVRKTVQALRGLAQSTAPPVVNPLSAGTDGVGDSKGTDDVGGVELVVQPSRGARDVGAPDADDDADADTDPALVTVFRGAGLDDGECRRFAAKCRRKSFTAEDLHTLDAGQLVKFLGMPDAGAKAVYKHTHRGQEPEREPVPAEVLAYQEKRLLDHNTRWSVLRFAVDVAAFGITAELIAREIRAGQVRWEPWAAAGLSLLGALGLTLFHLCRSKPAAEDAEEEDGWRFVPFAHAGSNVTLSQGGAVATKSGGGAYTNAVAAADESLSAGVHCWEVEITKGVWIMVGVCKADVRPESGTESLCNQQGKAWFMNAN